MMSDLRELIAGRIWHDDWVKNMGEEPPYPWDSEEYEDGMSAAVDAEYRDTADRIIELVRNALLTPEAVEAGARGIAFVGMEELYPDQDETWRTADEEQKELFRREIRSGITAALNTTGLGGER